MKKKKKKRSGKWKHFQFQFGTSRVSSSEIALPDLNFEANLPKSRLTLGESFKGVSSKPSGKLINSCPDFKFKFWPLAHIIFNSAKLCKVWTTSDNLITYLLMHEYLFNIFNSCASFFVQFFEYLCKKIKRNQGSLWKDQRMTEAAFSHLAKAEAEDRRLIKLLP